VRKPTFRNGLSLCSSCDSLLRYTLTRLIRPRCRPACVSSYLFQLLLRSSFRFQSRNHQANLKNNLLARFQFGFRRCHLTETAVVRIANDGLGLTSLVAPKFFPVQGTLHRLVLSRVESHAEGSGAFFSCIYNRTLEKIVQKHNKNPRLRLL